MFFIKDKEMEEQKENIHPDGFIKLLDGRIIAGHPLANPGPVINNNLGFDTTGVYLTMKGGKRHKRPKHDEIRQFYVEQFFHNIPLFLSNADKILSDSRMFLSPVMVENHSAYFGTSGLHKATLGVYIEWWLYYSEASHDTEGRPIWLISGSPLSGAHACVSVDDKGQRHDKCNLSGSFAQIWFSFMEVNRRYDEVKPLYEAFDICKVIEILEGNTPG